MTDDTRDNEDATPEERPDMNTLIRQSLRDKPRRYEFTNRKDQEEESDNG